MITVTQGHELSISLEIFIKAFLCLDSQEQQHFKLITNKKSLTSNLKKLKLPYILNKNSVNIVDSFLHIEWIDPKNHLTPSLSSLLMGIESINPLKDILLTMPTSKDQLVYKKKKHLGYTEFLRSYFKLPHLCMTFRGPDQNLLLLTDHISLKEVAPSIKKDLILNKLKTTLLSSEHYFEKIKRVFFLGINPHASENGLLGKEDTIIENAIKSLSNTYPSIEFLGPLPADSIHLKNISRLSTDLYVYPYHDQGLSPFKKENGTLGANITMGLPFLRMSVDHGTGFDIYGKNKANYMGCFYLLKMALKAQLKINEKNHEY